MRLIRKRQHFPNSAVMNCMSGMMVIILLQGCGFIIHSLLLICVIFQRVINIGLRGRIRQGKDLLILFSIRNVK